MPSSRKRPAWWQLYIGLPLLCSLFVFEIDLHLDQTVNIVGQLLILGLIFAFTRAWLRANRGALLEMDEHAAELPAPYGVQLYQLPAAEHVTAARVTAVGRRQLDIPQGEIKGVLSTTFEMGAEEVDSVFQPHNEDAHPEHALPLGNSRRTINKERE